MGAVAVLIVGLVLYVLSSGPAIWLIGRCGFPEYLLVPYEVIYKPLELAQNTFPREVSAPFNRYVEWWMAEFLSPAAGGSMPVPAMPVTEAAEGEDESAAIDGRERQKPD